MKKILFALGLIVTCLGGSSPVCAAESIQIRPLMYRETLEAGQVKRGVVDIANPTDKKISLHIAVKLFRQISDNGKLEFYDKPDATAGIVPEYTDFELEAKDVLRLGFTVDGSKLPQGDVFAALFATTKPTVPDLKTQAIIPGVQVGTLLVLRNGQAGPRHAEITDLQIPFVQIGTTIQGKIKVANPANSLTPTGFFPQIKISVSPWGPSKEFEGPLVYSGRTRNVDFKLPSDQFGVYKVVVTANDVTAERYVFIVSGIWRWLAPCILIVIVAVSAIGLRWFQRKRRIYFKKR